MHFEGGVRTGAGRSSGEGCRSADLPDRHCGPVTQVPAVVAVPGGFVVAHLVAEYEARRVAEFWQRWDGWLPTLSRPVRWRSVIPEADDYEAVFGELLDQLRPDALHAHDMHVIGVAARAAGRAALRGQSMQVVYDAHEYVPGLSQYGGRTPRIIAAWAQHEREYIRTADRVVTVSPAIARTLRRRYRLDHEPTVVINSPQLIAECNEITDVRAAAGLPADVPLLVYSGGVTRARGVETAIAALPRPPGVHLAVGEVFAAEDPEPYRERASDPGLRDQMSWQTQAGHLRTLCADLVGAPPSAASGAVHRDS